MTSGSAFRPPRSTSLVNRGSARNATARPPMTAQRAPIASRSAAAWRRTPSTDCTRVYPRAGKRSRSPASPPGLRSHAWTLASISSSEARGFSRRIRCRYIRTPASHMSKTTRNLSTSVAAMALIVGNSRSVGLRTRGPATSPAVRSLRRVPSRHVPRQRRARVEGRAARAGAGRRPAGRPKHLDFSDGTAARRGPNHGNAG